VEKSEVLKKYFGHSSFRQGQEEIIDNILSGRDCLGVMPTGAGKSMCYQIPAIMSHGVTIVISPLISLMKDQVESLVQSGVSAAYLNSSQSFEESNQVYSQASAGRIQILYVAPERLGTDGFVSLCERLTIPLVAVDEAHCVSHWGQDFRPSYLKISEFVSSLPKRPVLAAFTATATDIVKNDIVKILGLNDPFSITTGFDRKNLYFEVRKPKDKDAELLNIIKGSYGGSTIVYCSTRKNVENVCAMLNMNGCKAERYHAGLTDNERKTAQDDFIYDRCNIIVATNAFGMGIDKSDVSLVVHYNMPKDIESYYQEAGRAGRDGGPARCILLYSGRDVRIAEYMIENSHEDSELSMQELFEIRKRDRERLKQMTFYSTTTKCLREFILGYFGEKAPNYCGNCGSCNTSFETVDITLEAQKILSCIFRLKQRNRAVGKTTLVKILVGSKDEKIIESGYDTLSTYGIMQDISRTRVRDIVEFLVMNGYIDVSAESEYATCSLTPLADEFIKNRRSLLMKLPREEPAAEKSKKPKSDAPEDPELMKLLKELRKNLAGSLGVPAYVVFSDATLRQMSVDKPTTDAEFLNISGVGTMKAERYGKKFLGVIKEYVDSVKNND
jgi:ATP-dependent DNA helicase RecQ